MGSVLMKRGDRFILRHDAKILSKKVYEEIKLWRFHFLRMEQRGDDGIMIYGQGPDLVERGFTPHSISQIDTGYSFQVVKAFDPILVGETFRIAEMRQDDRLITWIGTPDGREFLPCDISVLQEEILPQYTPTDYSHIPSWGRF